MIHRIFILLLTIAFISVFTLVEYHLNDFLLCSQSTRERLIAGKSNVVSLSVIIRHAEAATESMRHKQEIKLTQLFYMMGITILRFNILRILSHAHATIVAPYESHVVLFSDNYYNPHTYTLPFTHIKRSSFLYECRVVCMCEGYNNCH